MKSRIYLLFLLCCLSITLTGCGGHFLQEHVKSENPGNFGVWEIGHRSFTLIDKSRQQRKLNIDVWYPVDDADVGSGRLSQYPLSGLIALPATIAMAGKPVTRAGKPHLIIFSHGYGGINTQSTQITETIASHGYIVAAIEHTGNAQSSPTDSFDVAAANRVPDVSFVIDQFYAMNDTPGDAFYGRIDLQGVGVVGHSFGGMTAIGTATGWAGAKPDSRVTAIVPISSPIEKSLHVTNRDNPLAGFSTEQLARINVPTLLIGGTADNDVLIENNAIAFVAIPSPVYKADISGATHTHFANVCDIGNLLLRLGIKQTLWPLIGATRLTVPYATTCAADALPMVEATRLTNQFTIAFLNRYLKNHADSVYLNPDFINSTETNVVLLRK